MRICIFISYSCGRREHLPRRKKNHIEYKCEDEFWENINNKDEYTKVANFECFIDIIKPIKDVSNYQNINFILNTEGWITYIFELSKHIIPGFIFDELNSTNSVFRFTKQLSSELKLGFEYDVANVKRGFKSGEFRLPEYFNLILINSAFQKTVKRADYIYNYNEYILSLGIMDNPFFHKSITPLINYATVELYRQDDDLELLNSTNIKFTPKYKTDILKYSDGTFQIVHPKEYGDKLKKHAFFYIKALAISSESYLTYIEKSILDTIFDLS